MTMFVARVHELIAFVLLINAVLAITKQEYIAAKLNSAPGKDPGCHDLVTYPACESDSTLVEDDWTLSGWFYHSMFKSCRPAYSSQIICKENKNIPKTREECEQLCGDPCTLRNGSEGVCKMDIFCPADMGAVKNSCGSKRTNCCPKKDDRNFLYSKFADDEHVKLLKYVVFTKNSSGIFHNLGFPIPRKTKF